RRFSVALGLSLSHATFASLPRFPPPHLRQRLRCASAQATAVAESRVPLPAMESSLESARHRYSVMIALVVAGEMIFSLPFHLPRYFRPSVLETFGLRNADLG